MINKKKKIKKRKKLKELIVKVSKQIHIKMPKNFKEKDSRILKKF